ncbi:MAG: Hcp family type VI secretion system effector [Candidatus Hodarchaeales archaeon]|jgi:type VI secretion system Hcp family effector
MKVKQNFRMVALLGIVLGATIMVLLTFGIGQYANASTGSIEAPSFNAVVMYVSYEGIDGESLDPDGGKSSLVYGYSHSVINPYDPVTGDVTVRQHSPLRIVKSMDKSSPKLQEACNKGSVLPKVNLNMYFKSDSEYKKFYAIELTNAKITSFQGFGTVSADEFPKETVSFTYETIKWTYTEYDEAGNPMGNVEYVDTWVSPPPV